MTGSMPETLAVLLARGDELTAAADAWVSRQEHGRATACATLASAYYGAVTARAAAAAAAPASEVAPCDWLTSATCPGCGRTFRDLAGSDPLKFHERDCEEYRTHVEVTTQG